MRKFGRVLVVGALALLVACASQATVKGRPKDPLVLMRMAMTAHLQGDWADSNQKIEACLGLLAKRPDIKLGEQAGALLLTKDLKGYSGDPEELVFLHSLGMLNYAMLGQLDEALVEARRSDEVQRWMVDQGKAVGDDPLGRLISAGLYLQQGHADDALIDLKRAHEAYRNAGENQQEPAFLAKDIEALEAAGTHGPSLGKLGEVWVLVYSGILEVDGGKVRSRELLQEASLRGGQGPAVALEQVQDLEPLVRRAITGREFGDFVRSTSQVAMRSALILALALFTQGNIPDGSGEFIGDAARRDDRHWNNLPARIHAAHLLLKPGLQTLVLDSVVGGVPVQTSATVRVQAGRIALAQASFQGVDYHLRLSPSLKP